MNVMFDCDDGMIEQHAWSAPPHNLSHQTAHCWSIAVDWTAFARCFILSKLTVVQSFMSIRQEVLILLWEFVLSQPPTAVEPNHNLYYILLALDSRHANSLF